MERDAIVASVLDRTDHKNASTRGGELEHLLVRELVELSRERHDTGVCGVDALDVGVDLTGLGVERGCQRDGRRVRAATPKGRDGRLRRDALEAGDDRDLALLKRLLDAIRAYLGDAGTAMSRVGEDPRLGPGERDRLAAELRDRHREQRHRDALSRCEEHVELAWVRVGGHAGGEIDELVGRVAHGRDDDADRSARCGGLHHAFGNPFDAGGVSDGRAAVFLHDAAHGRKVAARAVERTWQ